jgi:hypothetical protein
MFLSKKHLDRRTFLRGTGATVALPLLDAMVPAWAKGAGKPIPRMAFVYFPHGAIMNEWTPAETGRQFQLGRILEPLAPFEERLTIVSGLENRHAYGPVHAITPGTWLSGVSPGAVAESTGAFTADQIAAQHLGGDTPLPSLQVAAEPPLPISAGAWEGRYSSSLGSTISFRGSSTPLPMEFNPRKVFDQLFARDATPADRAVRERGRSILDFVAEDAAYLRKRLDSSDRALLRDYLDGVRDVERRVDTATSSAGRLTLMFDLIALAFQADVTRVTTFMMAAETSRTTYDDLGLPETFHALSHHQNDPANVEKLVRVQRYHTEAFASFVGRLEDVADGDGSLLDRSLILYGSNMSNSHAHDHFPLPLALVGGACGAVRGGQHLRYPDRTPASNVLLTMLQRCGVAIERVGDSTGGCAEV